MTTGQLHIDLRESVTNAVALIDQAVVYANGPKNDRGNYAQEYQ